MKQKVAIVKTRENPEEAVRVAVDLLGGFDNFFSSGDTYLLKPNLFTSKEAKTGATTDMKIVLGITEILQAQNCKAILGECPATFYHSNPLRADVIFDELGIRKLCQEKNIGIRALDSDLPVNIRKQGFVLNDFYFPKTCIDYPVINIPTLKTHPLTMLSNAVKNLFGLQQGGIKARHHVATGNDPERFNHLLLDLYDAIRHRIKLNVVDAIVAMEGEGPVTGDPVDLGLVIVSEDALAVDIVSSAIMGWDPMDVGTNYLAAKRGLGPKGLDDVEVVGAQISEVRKRLKKPKIFITNDLRAVRSRIRMPIVCDSEKCRGCGTCADICPGNAIEMKSIPEFNHKKCIECYCCIEQCPHEAITTKETLRFGILSRLSQIRTRMNT
jgi:uncharacterized protein (DUF362 family)